MSKKIEKTQVLVLGGGPGGYAAAFKAADLGLQVTLVDTEANPGGVCLYKGCIPSKALLHVAKVINESKEASEFGLSFSPPKIDLAKLKAWKEEVVSKLTGGLGMLTKQRKINYIQGRGDLIDPHQLLIQTTEGEEIVLPFEYCMLATGSRPFIPPHLALESPHLWNSTRALALEEIPEKLLVVGGGYIGLELGSVYSSLGSQVEVVEMAEALLPTVDKDLIRPLARKLEGVFKNIRLKSKVLSISEKEKGLAVVIEDAEGKKTEEVFDKVLVSAGRKPNSSGIGLRNCGILKDEKDFIKVDAQRRTNLAHIFAIGDVAGEPMLAHKATHEGIVAAEVVAGENVVFDPRCIPAVIFTDPEVAWCGLTEIEAKKQNLEVKVSRFPWTASGRALSLGRSEGVTKIICDAATERVLGVGIVGVGAGDLISEGVLAIEMGATASDLKLSIHPHPTLSETLMEAAEGVGGTSLHVYKPKRT